ncbi:hypothetical protein Cgig2_020786 [Carnegiea gigantea]|uniref:Uncharacterized protein n=1 Tax=Carnegiea gigantea TaxID=171969 RepID=A0A9Q1GID5_9CARY|nr:hypothetical protein Cgig2_020786 [Carnegiea gigantea]
MQSKGPHFSWTNKTIWTRIDRVFVNVYWYELFGFSQVIYMANSLSDHAAMIIDTPGCSKPRSTFQFCDIWPRASCFFPLITARLQGISHLGPYRKLEKFLRQIQVALQQLSRSQFADLKQQQLIDALRQQCKAEWITYRDDCTRVNQGFLAVATIPQNYYKGLPREKDIQRCCIDPQVICMGNTLAIDQQLSLCASFLNKDIKTAMFSIPNTKFPVPNGYSNGFFKSTWHSIGGLVKEAI